jgi:hypothetical protein
VFHPVAPSFTGRSTSQLVKNRASTMILIRWQGNSACYLNAGTLTEDLLVSPDGTAAFESAESD